MCQALLEIMEPEINKIVVEATERVRRETEEIEGLERGLAGKPAGV